VTYARHPQGSMPYRRILIALFFAGVATFAQLYSPQGVLPAIAADIGVSPATASLTISVATAGVALSTAAVSLFYFAYLAGTWSSAQVSRWTSRFGRIPTLLVCLATLPAASCSRSPRTCRSSSPASRSRQRASSRRMRSGSA